MATIHTFKDLLEDRYSDEISNCLAEYITENPDKLEGKSNFVEEPDEAELLDMNFEFVDITKSPGNKLDFDVVVSTEIEVRERKRHSDVDDDVVYQWFRISCSAVFDDGLKNIKTTDVEVYNKQGRDKKGHLSEFLVPITYKEDLDDVAEDFLLRHYPEVLEKPMPLPVLDLAKRMNLQIEQVHITKLCSFFG